MKIGAISDTHNKHHNIKTKELDKCDVVICSGDISGNGTQKEIESFCKWFGSRKPKHKLLVAGNHDFLFQKEPKKARAICEKYGITYLQDYGVVIDGVYFYGSPWQPQFCDWAFNAARDPLDIFYYNGKVKTFPLIKQFWDMIPETTDVLITHGPPYGILDELLFVDGTPKGVYVGNRQLTNLESLI